MGKYELDLFKDRLDRKLNEVIEEVRNGPKKKPKKKKDKPVIETFNILNDTLEMLEHNGKSVFDVKWVGGEDFRITWETFERIANIEIRHDEARNIASDLVIVGEDWWLERDFWGLDGYYSAWSFKTMPIQPDKLKDNIDNLLIDEGNNSLAEASKLNK